MKYQYKQYIPAVASAPALTMPPYAAANLTNDFGLSCDESEHALHNNHPNGDTMWLLENACRDFEIVFDLGGYFPVGEMYVWNYNRKPDASDNTLCGLREISLFTSVDSRNYKSAAMPTVILAKANGKDNCPATNLASGGVIDFDGVTARYVKLCVCAKPGLGNYDDENIFNNSFGLSKIKFFMGEGFAVQRDSEWTSLFCRSEGWTGSDGVFTIPMSGSERHIENTDTTITFGDTLIDKIDAVTMRRGSDFVMIHNSSCFLKNSLPKADDADFTWKTDTGSKPESLLSPPLSVQYDQSASAYYWPQDSVLIGNKCYTFPFTIQDWPEGPEGFQFKVDGVAMVVSPLEGGRIRFDKAEHRRVPLYYHDKDKSITFGGCVLPYTKRAGFDGGDGYIYLYGSVHQDFSVGLCVARIKEENIENAAEWTYFDGECWSGDISKVKTLANGVSCELSVSRLEGKYQTGRFILVHHGKANAPIVSCRLADRPWGPFGEEQELFFTNEILQGRGIYTYNAKAHPHLAPKGELLVSYNVNTVAWEMHMAHGDICRPKFLRIYEVVK